MNGCRNIFENEITNIGVGIERINCGLGIERINRGLGIERINCWLRIKRINCGIEITTYGIKTIQWKWKKNTH